MFTAFSWRTFTAINHLQCDHKRTISITSMAGLYQFGGGLPINTIIPESPAHKAGLQS